ncbi:MAG: 4'-phosphopantetheinyl transferase superfamily protein [Chitinophagales bacterium]|nr:4'-phosphopantetheinyl transferase superfamily protein [Chitinophagales bacterium]
MPLFFQQQINEHTRLGVWKIEETEAFFKGNVPVHRDVTHPRKRLQHLAGRFLLQYLFPDFPYPLIQIADTRKPFLTDERYHFSISHCGDFAASIVSRHKRVGVDVERVAEKIISIKDKFLTTEEQLLFTATHNSPDPQALTIAWSAKEAVFKWYGKGQVDFRKNIQLQEWNKPDSCIKGWFTLTGEPFRIHYRIFDHLILAWISGNDALNT